MTTKSSVTILPESDDFTLCLRFDGAVTKQDHYDNLVVPMRAMIEKHGYYNLLIFHAQTYQGYEPDAAEQSFNSINEMGKYARRIAYVNPTARKLFQTNLTRVLLGKEVKNFDTAELEAAIMWVKAED